MGGYVHGYDGRETLRLEDQARTLEELLHGDTAFPDGAEVLEAGCGTGAQTVALARRSPRASITAVDLSAASLEAAQARVAAAGISNVGFQQADLLAAPFAPASFDHVFLCFVLEHLPDPAAALAALRPLLRPGGTITAIEGDHGSTLFHPESARRPARPSPAKSSCSAAREVTPTSGAGSTRCWPARASRRCGSRRGWSMWMPAGLRWWTASSGAPSPR